MGENPHSQNQLLNQYISKLEIRFILIDNGLCPDWSREEHTRMRDCFYLILDGQGKITVNGEAFIERKTIWYCCRKIQGYRYTPKTKLATINIGATFPQQLTASRYLI